MIRFTASRRALLSACAAWARPDAVWTDSGSDAATAGSEMHDAIESVIANPSGQTRTHSAAAVRKAAHAVDALAGLLAMATARHTEVAYEYSLRSDSATVLGHGREAYDGAERDSLCGTADLVLDFADGIPMVIDYKSWAPGQDVDARAQLRTLALFAARAMGRDTVRTATLLVGEDGARLVEGDTLDAFELDAEAYDLRADLARIPNAEPVPGPHCAARYCPAIATCEATREAMTHTLPASMLVRQHRLSPVIADAEHAAWTYAALRMVEAATDEIAKALKAYADEHGGIVLSDGSVYGGHETTRETLDLSVPGAVEAVRAAGGEAALSYSSSKAALTREIGKASKALLEELSAMGALRASTFTTYKATKAKKRAA